MSSIACLLWFREAACDNLRGNIRAYSENRKLNSRENNYAGIF